MQDPENGLGSGSAGSDYSSSGNNLKGDYEGTSVNQIRMVTKNGTKIFASKLEEIVEEPIMGASNANSIN